MAIAVALSCVTGASAQQLAFDDGWELSGDATRVETYLGRSALRFRSGSAIRRDVLFQDGTIELDIATTGDRAFVYVQFRMEADGHEEFYFRPHKSGLPDAIQYTPVMNGEGNWQLYHGDGGTAAADFPDNVWTHVKLVVSGTKAAVFIGDVSEPQLVVEHLARTPKPGYIALRSFLATEMPDNAYPTSYSNVVIRPNVVDFDFPDVAAEVAAPQGMVSEWSISEPFKTPEGPVVTLPPLERETWRKVATEPSGLLLLFRHVARPERGRATLYARLTLSSAREQRVPLDLGYSDEVTVFLNGNALLYADDSYSFDRPRRDGLIGLDQTTVFLPLKAGDNDLVLAVTDGFGGWGLMGKLEASDVKISARE